MKQIVHGEFLVFINICTASTALEREWSGTTNMKKVRRFVISVIKTVLAVHSHTSAGIVASSNVRNLPTMVVSSPAEMWLTLPYSVLVLDPGETA